VTPYTAEFGWDELRRLEPAPRAEDDAAGG
jgi:hypothetical protein